MIMSPSEVHVRRIVSMLAILLACSSSKYVAPVPFTYDGPRSDGVPYRTLTRADFQATELDSRMKGIDAKTAITFWADSVVVTAVEMPENSFDARWLTSLREVRFHTLMYPKASWWNPKRTSEKDTRRILEHEQTHFDIAELVIRQANARVRSMSATGATADAALKKAQEMYQTEADRAREMLVERNAQYDRETKNGSDQSEQKRWTDRVKKDLAETPRI
jgi:hypothetical protein